MDENWLENFRLHFGLGEGIVWVDEEKVIQIDTSLSQTKILQMQQWLTEERRFGYKIKPANVARVYKDR